MKGYHSFSFFSLFEGNLLLAICDVMSFYIDGPQWTGSMKGIFLMFHIVE